MLADQGSRAWPWKRGKVVSNFFLIMSFALVASALVAPPAGASSFSWSYNANGGGGTMTNLQSFTTCKAYALTTAFPPTRAGFTLIGWSLNTKDGLFLGNGTYENCTNITLFAQWNYTVSFDANGGSTPTPSTTNTASGITLPVASRDGFDFQGWYTQGSGGTRVGGAGDVYNPNANVTAFAQWAAATYTVTFSEHGGIVFPTTATFTVGDPALTLPTANRAGHTFNGWYTAAIGGSLVGTAGAPYTPSATTTLHAQWTPDSPPAKPPTSDGQQQPQATPASEPLDIKPHVEDIDHEGQQRETTNLSREDLLSLVNQTQVLRIRGRLVLATPQAPASWSGSVQMSVIVEQRGARGKWRIASPRRYRLLSGDPNVATIVRLTRKPLRVRVNWTIPTAEGSGERSVTKVYRVW